MWSSGIHYRSNLTKLFPYDLYSTFYLNKIHAVILMCGSLSKCQNRQFVYTSLIYIQFQLLFMFIRAARFHTSIMGKTDKPKGSTMSSWHELINSASQNPQTCFRQLEKAQIPLNSAVITCEDTEGITAADVLNPPGVWYTNDWGVLPCCVWCFTKDYGLITKQLHVHQEQLF